MIEAIRAQNKRLEVFHQPAANPLEPRVRKLYFQGVQQKEIAQKLGTSLGQIKYIVRRSQWKKSPQGRR